MRIKRKRDFDEAELPKAQRVRWYIFTAIVALLALSLIGLPYQQWFADRYIAQTTVSTSITWIVLQTAGLAVFLILALYGTGRIRLERAAYRADQFDVQDFLDAKGEKVPEVTAVFKRMLNESRLYTPTAVPGVGTSFDFIQIVEDAGEAMDSWWKAASRLVKLVRPPSAFRVSGTIWLDEATGKHRLILELVRAPRFAASPMVIEDETLPRVLERAANAVAALVMPRSKYCVNVYGVSWRNTKIPAELFDAYQRANMFTLERRYDEALAEHNRAIDWDPTNIYIKLEIGTLQEQLDLMLDALATYDDVITLCCRGTPKLANWWIGPDFTRQRRELKARHANALLVARYRHALVLGQGDRIAASWWVRKPIYEDRPEADPRSVQRAHQRAALYHRFQRYTRLDIRSADRWISWDERQSLHRELFTFPIEELSTTPADPTDPMYQRKRIEYADRSRRLRAYLAALSQFEIERLINDYHPYRTLRFRRARNLSQTVSVVELRLALVRSVLRRAMADADVHGGRIPVHQSADPRPGRKTRLGWLFPTGRWPVDVNNLVMAVRATRSRWRRTPYWSESYNAACVYAVALLPVDPLIAFQLSGQAADSLAKLAVTELNRVANTNHSSQLASRRSWVLAEDPDLASLRGRAHFRNFEIATFSPTRPVTLRPRKVREWEQVSYLCALISEIGRCRSKYWHDRISVPDAPDDSETNRSERDAWRLVSRLIAGQQDWFRRYEAVTAFHGWAAKFGYDGVVEGFPLYSESSLAWKYAGLLTGNPEESDNRPSGIDQINQWTQRYIKECDRRMERAVVALRNLVGADGDKDTADDRSHRWAALADWFDDSSARSPAMERESRFLGLVINPASRD